MDKENIIKFLEKHLRWVKGEEGGEQANLSGADLSGADLSGADLSWANLSGADLSVAYLSGADLIGAYLSGANLSRADLSGANLIGANLSRANLSGANIKIFHGGKWIAFIDPELIRIGCKCFTSSEWDGFSDEIIDNMANGALEYWKENKEIIMTIAKQLQEKFPDNKESS